MNEQGKEWLKKNWYRPVLHTIPCIIFFVVCWILLEIWTLSISKTSITWNLFITVTVFGALCWITLLMIYVDKWSDRFDIYKKEYKQFEEKK